ncbi:MAG TPA: GGDEF domain-containing protein [Ancylobacter sp.]
MLLDYSSLLISVGFSALCLAALLFAVWVSARDDGFLLTTAAAAALIVGNIVLYSLYLAAPSPLRAAAAFVVLLVALSLLYGAAHQFRRDVSPIRPALAGATTLLVAVPPTVLGYDGVGFALYNLCAAVLLVAAAREYWRGRAEARVAIAGLCLLYIFVAVSFALCAMVLVLDGKLVLDGPPSNWAENFNILAVIAGVPGVGAVTLALKQIRLAQAHKRDAMTDPLTGLLNRRALFDAFGDRPLPERTAVLVFDIDRFKSINDRHGHSVGDQVILAFASALNDCRKGPALAARLGGEEFALVVSSVTAESALRLAEEVREKFCVSVERLAIDGLNCSASAGIAFGVTHGTSFESVLSEADKALYAAKNSGRDRVHSAELRLAG